jgi:hypothetical protein
MVGQFGEHHPAAGVADEYDARAAGINARRTVPT